MINNWNDCKKILCVRLDNIGDLIMTMPAIKALKDTDPLRQITLMVSSAAEETAKAFAVADEVLVYDAPWMKASKTEDDHLKDFAIIQALQERQFHGAVIFTVFSQSPLPAALMCFLAGIPQCLAYCHENPYQLINHWIKDPDPEAGIRHEVQRQLDLVLSIGAKPLNSRICFEVPLSRSREVLQRLQQEGISQDKPLIVLHPGATAPSRRYPADKFIRVADELINREYQVVMAGREEERALIDSITRALAGRAKSFINEFNFEQLAALIEMADVLVTNNTAPAHIAAAVQTPVVVLYALTNPQHTPWMVASRVLSYDVPCKFCFKSICPHGHHECLEKVAWQEVVEKVEELLLSNMKAEKSYVYFRD